ncbi:Bug family tripartite tricarboxylate transporter substrate binding protein [Advenella kashmirensis]
MRFLKSILCASVAFIALTSLPAHAADSDWPNAKPFRVVVPYPAGGSADILGRLVAKKLSENLGNNAVVENIAGGGTIPAALSVLKDKADGYTLFVASDNTLNINNFLLKEPRYDGDKDFTSVTVLNTYAHWLIVNKDSPFKSMEDLKKYIIENPNKASISVNTIGGSAYLALDKWKKENKLDFEIIPYRGSPPAVSDLIGGITTAHIDVAGSSMSYYEGGKVKPLAVLQSQPLKKIPSLETQSYDDPKALTVKSNLSVVVKNGTPPEILEKLYQALKKGEHDKDFTDALNLFAYEAVLTPPAESRKFILEETQRYKKLVEASGLEKQ